MDEGTLALDESVVRYWPQFPDPSGGSITVRHLLAHRSGLRHWGAIDDFLSHSAAQVNDPFGLLQEFASLGLEFPPGERESYSSLGYYALGLLMEHITGQSYAELLRRRVFDPLGMSRSSLDDATTIVEGRAQAYRYNFLLARYDNAEHRHPSTTFSTGGILTTVDDLLRWERALGDASLLSPGLWQTIFDPAEGESAFGWRKVTGEDPDRDIHWHGGLVTGFRSQITRMPSARRTVILFGNLRDADTNEITDRIFEILDGQRAELPRKSLMKEVLRRVADEGPEAAIRRFDQVLLEAAEDYRTEPTQLFIAALELRSDGACESAAPLYEHWVSVYVGNPLEWTALAHGADCWLRVGHAEKARRLIDRLRVGQPSNRELASLEQRLARSRW